MPPPESIKHLDISVETKDINETYHQRHIPERNRRDYKQLCGASGENDTPTPTLIQLIK